MLLCKTKCKEKKLLAKEPNKLQHLHVKTTLNRNLNSDIFPPLPAIKQKSVARHILNSKKHRRTTRSGVNYSVGATEHGLLIQRTIHSGQKRCNRNATAVSCRNRKRPFNITS